jgi:hypothetical protein
LSTPSPAIAGPFRAQRMTCAEFWRCGGGRRAGTARPIAA